MSCEEDKKYTRGRQIESFVLLLIRIDLSLNFYHRHELIDPETLEGWSIRQIKEAIEHGSLWEAILSTASQEKLDDLPYLAIGNGELDDHDDVGDTIICPHCGQEHDIGYGERVFPDGTREETKYLAFYRCEKSGKTYLAAVNGKLLRR